MKSPFKFPDSYTKDDREIFFGRDRVFPGPGILLEDIIPPLQGLNGCMCSFSRWTLSNAHVLCAYSAKTLFLIRPERAKNIKTGQRPVYQIHNDKKPCKGEIP
jgi:hypothetical protein